MLAKYWFYWNQWEVCPWVCGAKTYSLRCFDSWGWEQNLANNGEVCEELKGVSSLQVGLFVLFYEVFFPWYLVFGFFFFFSETANSLKLQLEMDSLNCCLTLIQLSSFSWKKPTRRNPQTLWTPVFLSNWQDVWRTTKFVGIAFCLSQWTKWRCLQLMLLHEVEVDIRWHKVPLTCQMSSSVRTWYNF